MLLLMEFVQITVPLLLILMEEIVFLVEMNVVVVDHQQLIVHHVKMAFSLIKEIVLQAAHQKLSKLNNIVLIVIFLVMAVKKIHSHVFLAELDIIISVEDV